MAYAVMRESLQVDPSSPELDAYLWHRAPRVGHAMASCTSWDALQLMSLAALWYGTGGAREWETLSVRLGSDIQPLLGLCFAKRLERLGKPAAGRELLDTLDTPTAEADPMLVALLTNAFPEPTNKATPEPL